MCLLGSERLLYKWLNRESILKYIPATLLTLYSQYPFIILHKGIDLEERCALPDETPRQRIKRIFYLDQNNNEGKYNLRHESSEMLQFELIERLPNGQRNKARFRNSLNCAAVCGKFNHEKKDSTVKQSHMKKFKEPPEKNNSDADDKVS